MLFPALYLNCVIVVGKAMPDAWSVLVHIFTDSSNSGASGLFIVFAAAAIVAAS